MPPRKQRIEAVRALVRAARVLERGSGELSLAHYRVLAAIAGGDERATRVAARLALGKPTISASVDALCRRGLLSREEDATDQRAAALRLTPAGEAALVEVETALLARLDSVLVHAPDQAALLASLGQLGTALDGLAEERLRVPANR